MRRIAFILCVAILGGCGARPLTEGGGAGAGPVAIALDGLGDWFLCAGAVFAVLGVAARIYFSGTPFAAFATFAAEIGICAGVFGIFAIYLSAHAWIFPVAGGVALLAFTFRYRDQLFGWLRVRPSSVPPSSPANIP
jgi:hypothetical protein